MEQWYVDVGGVSQEFPVVGAVVHDEGEVFDRALAHMSGNKCFFVCPEISRRFSVRVLRNDHYGSQCVLLIGTGMGGSGSSIVVHELARQLQGRGRRVLKVGTCVSTWDGDQVGDVQMPRWAIADDDVVEWDRRWSRASANDARFSPDQVFRGKRVVRPNDELWKAWSGIASWESWDPTAVWSTNTHYPIVLCSNFFQLLAQKHVMHLVEDSSVVGGITRFNTGCHFGKAA